MVQVYHYTTMAGLHGMLCNPAVIGEDDTTNKDLIGKKALTMWATAIYNLNDPMEMRTGYYIIADKLKVLEKRLNVKDSEQLSKVFYLNDGDGSKIFQALIEKIQSYQFMPYITSFSSLRNSLSMMNLYGGNSTGGGLTFDNNGYNVVGDINGKWEVQVFKKLEASKVVYGALSDDDVVMPYIQDRYKKYLSEIKSVQNDLLPAKLDVITEMLVCAAPYIKTVDYKDETEYRLIKYEQDINKVRSRVNNNGNIVTYIDIHIPIDYLTEIRIGPCANFRLAQMNINQLLMKYGKNIPITPFDAAYRQY